MIKKRCCRRQTLLQELLQGVALRNIAIQSGSINKKYQEINFELKNLFTGLTQNPGFEKIDVIIKNEALNVLFFKRTFT